MKSTPDQLDQIINDHFMFEATDDIDGVLGSLAEAVEHEVMPSPVGISRDKKEIRFYYELLFKNVTGQSLTPIRRYYGDDFVVD